MRVVRKDRVAEPHGVLLAVTQIDLVHGFLETFGAGQVVGRVVLKSWRNSTPPRSSRTAMSESAPKGSAVPQHRQVPGIAGEHPHERLVRVRSSPRCRRSLGS